MNFPVFTSAKFNLSLSWYISCHIKFYILTSIVIVLALEERKQTLRNNLSLLNIIKDYFKFVWLRR